MQKKKKSHFGVIVLTAVIITVLSVRLSSVYLAQDGRGGGVRL